MRMKVQRVSLGFQWVKRHVDADVFYLLICEDEDNEIQTIYFRLGVASCGLPVV